MEQDNRLTHKISPFQLSAECHPPCVCVHIGGGQEEGQQQPRVYFPPPGYCVHNMAVVSIWYSLFFFYSTALSMSSDAKQTKSNKKIKND